MIPTNRSTPLLLPVSPAEPTIIGTPSRRAASSMCSRSCLCHCSGLDETSAPSGPGPTSHDPESAQIRSGALSSPSRKLPILIGAKPRCPLGHRIRSEEPGARMWSQRCREQAGDGEGVEQDQLVTDFEALSGTFDPVAVEAGRKQPGFA